MFADLFLIGDGLSWLESLDKQALLDLNGSDSLYLDRVAKGLTNAFTWIPLYISLFYIVLKNNENVQKVLMVLGAAALCVLLAGTVDDLIVKPMVGRWRPTRDPEIGMLVDIVDGYRGGRFGFFSAHAANTFSIAVFFSLLVRSRVFTIFIMAWSLLNAWTRLYLGVHYPSDVIVGLAYGAFVGIMVYLIFMKLYMIVTDKLHFISSQYTRTGYGFSDIDIVHNVLLLTIVYAVIHAAVSAF